MGSYLSCASLYILPSNTVKVMFFNGSLREFQRQIKAAELMLENPQHFVCHSNSLQVGRRINPLSADEDLEMGHLYFLLPMSKLKAVLSGSDVASIAFKAEIAMKKVSRNGGRILTVFADQRPLVRGQGTTYRQDTLFIEADEDGEFQEKAKEHLDLDDVVVPKMDIQGLISEVQLDLEKYRLGSFKSWKPKLETIREAEKIRA